MKHKVIKAETMGPWKAAAAAYLAVFIFIPERSGEIGACACTGLGQFIWNLVPVFLCVGLMDVWIERDKMIKMMGDSSGLSGMGISLLLGMLTAVPVCAASHCRPAVKKGRAHFQCTDFPVLQCEYPNSASAF